MGSDEALDTYMDQSVDYPEMSNQAMVFRRSSRLADTINLNRPN